MPIGYNSSNLQAPSTFKGTLDGRGFAIQNLDILLNKDWNKVGLFSKFGETTVIKNLNFKSLNIILASTNFGSFNAGSLVGDSDYSIIENVHVLSGKLHVEGKGGQDIGGIAGRAGGYITRCSVNLDIKGPNYTGGIVGLFRNEPDKTRNLIKNGLLEESGMRS